MNNPGSVVTEKYIVQSLQNIAELWKVVDKRFFF